MSQWGHDFRVDYKELGKVRFEFFQNVPLMAFTATATATVKNDILKLLLVNGKEILVFQKSFNRPELRYEVRSKKNHRQFISDVSAYILSKQLNNTGIIYCGTQMACEKVCKDLQEAMKNEGYERKIGFYHAGLEPLERERIQREWSEDQLKIIVATVAFGMGINKTDCRCCQILKYFSEVFNRDFCGVPMHQLCDNCSQPRDFEVVDVTHIAIELVRLRFPFSLAMKGSVRMQSAADDQHADFSRSRTAQRSEAARARVRAVASLVRLRQGHLQARNGEAGDRSAAERLSGGEAHAAVEWLGRRLSRSRKQRGSSRAGKSADPHYAPEAGARSAARQGRFDGDERRNGRTRTDRQLERDGDSFATGRHAAETTV